MEINRIIIEMACVFSRLFSD